jgi:dolichyl-phosphate-mannose-protein mannosyltransferase
VEEQERVRRPAWVRAFVVVALVTAAGGAVRFWDLGSPREKVFDEVYYATDGCFFAGITYYECGLEDAAERSWVHPPLGKHMISWGIHLFGDRPLGWRFSSAVAGALAFLLTRSALWAGLGALLVATEHLHFVQSRISMLDIFQAMFAVLGFLLLVWDRVRQDRRDALVLEHEDEERPTSDEEEDLPAAATVAVEEPAWEAAAPRRLGASGPRWMRVGAGAALAAGTAVKWSGVFALAGAGLLAFGWEWARHRRARVRLPLLATLRDEAPALLLAFVVVPLLVYTAAWTSWLWDHGFDLGGWFDNHRAIADFHLTLESVKENGEPVHPYMSRAWTWLLLLRPVAYYFEDTNGTSAEILGIGSPLVFWGALLVIPYLLVMMVWRRDWRAGALAVPILVQYVPWLFVSRPLFLFYMTPVTPFLALGMTYLLADVAGEPEARPSRSGAVAAAVIGVVAVGLFVFFWPVLVGAPIPTEAWQHRIWFGRWV